MRFSAVQEDGCGIGLGQETPPSDVDESMMAATGDLEPSGGCAIEEGSMISNLPLLFANGYPTSLEKITLPELERFVTFMVQCSLGHDTTDVIIEPQWWPKEIKFSIPLVRPKKINESYMDNLKKLVFRCYTYHRSEYLLRFCSYLAQYPHNKLEYVNNWDSTTSLYLKPTGKLLVTFRNENMNYDRKILDPRKMLLPLKKTKKNLPNGTKCLRTRSAQKQAPSPAMVEPPSDDIYLCDNCDAEFIGLSKMKEHEKLCYRVEPRPITPEAEIIPELKQNQFMEYFKLKSTSSTDSTDSTEKVTSVPLYDNNNEQNRSSGRLRGAVNLSRCTTIPFSSPAGLTLVRKSKMTTENKHQELMDKIEKYSCAPPLGTSIKPKWLMKSNEFDRWSVTYKPNRDRTPKTNEYVHKYNFGNYTGKPVLDLRSQLLFVACKPLYVVINRLSDEDLEELKTCPSRYKTPEREVPRILPRSPLTEAVHKPAPGDETNPIIIDLEDDEFVTSNQHTSQITRNKQVRTIERVIVTPHMSPVMNAVAKPLARMSTPTIVNRQQSLLNNRVSASSAAKRARSAKSIILVDLCSSDEEESPETQVRRRQSGSYVSVDENRDPLKQRATSTVPEMRVEPTFVRTSVISPNKPFVKPCFYPTNSSTSWLSNLNLDGESSHKDLLSKHNSILKGTP